ncbi:MAG: hypothetical protein ACE37I_20230 [Rubinisphaera brasiliensis]|uniref:hypothetical protein n=1 Tax=Rubinisphaera brasiliensis TaxID=119 RepID=UPI00391BA59C
MARTVRECMEVAWRTETGHEIVAGLTFYGWFPSLLAAGDVQTLWPSLAAASYSIQSEQIEITKEASYSSVDHGSILVCTVRIHDWPSANAWPDFVKQILSRLLSIGAKVAWCGNELCAHSPDIFIPETATGNIYAALSNHAGYVCRSPELTDKYVPLCDRDLLSVKKSFAST